mmetsp:Transcript_31055/g.36447  ORF Transcript_31055/g.36447 Transcript_31055/m.36447 type:complete len:96 (-) Transcript_31055:716-1003(-)
MLCAQRIRVGESGRARVVLACVLERGCPTGDGIGVGGFRSVFSAAFGSEFHEGHVMSSALGANVQIAVFVASSGIVVLEEVVTKKCRLDSAPSSI